MSNPFDSAEYKRSRKSYIAYSTFEYFVSILATDVFLAKLLTNIGLEDSLIGIVSSIISLACIFQLLALLLMKKISSIKKAVMIFAPCSQILFMAMYITPFLPVSASVKAVLVIAFLVLAYVCHYMIFSPLFKWANSYVAPDHRGVYSATKEMISLASGIVFTLIVGYVLDYFELSDNINGGFLFIASSILILSICNVVFLLMIKKDTPSKQEVQSSSLKEVLRNTLGNRNFVNIVIMSSMWQVARYLTVGFLGTFKTNDLLLSVGTVQVINMVANLFRFFISRPFGRYSDRTSYAKGVKLALLITSVGFIANTFTNRDFWWGIVIYTIFYAVGLAGTNQNASNIVYSYVDSKYTAQAMAIKSSIGGVCGFVASLLGSRILTFVQENGNTFLGIPMYGQQLLSFISFLIIIACVLFIQFVIEKQKVLVQ